MRETSGQWPVTSGQGDDGVRRANGALQRTEPGCFWDVHHGWCRFPIWELLVKSHEGGEIGGNCMIL